MNLKDFLRILNDNCREYNQQNNVPLETSGVEIDFESERFKALDCIFNWNSERGKEMIQRLYVE